MSYVAVSYEALVRLFDSLGISRVYIPSFAATLQTVWRNDKTLFYTAILNNSIEQLYGVLEDIQYNNITR